MNCFASLIAGVLVLVASAEAAEFELKAQDGVERHWLAPELWSNPMEDWKLSGGKFFNTHSGGNRNVVLLNAELSDRAAAMSFEVDVKVKELGENGFVGLVLGLQGAFDDFRDSAIYGAGLSAGINAQGELFIGERRMTEATAALRLAKAGCTMVFRAEPEGEKFRGTIALRREGQEEIKFSVPVHPGWLQGLVGVVASSEMPVPVRPEQTPQRRAIGQRRGGAVSAEFSRLKLTGEKVELHPERTFGPIFWTQHTLDSNGTFKLLVQLAPVGNGERTVELHAFEEIYREELEPHSRTVVFTIEQVDVTQAHAYEVVYEGHAFAGSLRAEPRDKEQLVVASLSCNDSTGFPHNQLVANVGDQRPDVMAFLGDQIYEGIGGYGAVRAPQDGSHDDRSTISFLRKYAMHGWTWRELMRDIPTFAIPDDHDVFHGNIWGAGGDRADISRGQGGLAQDSGGYKMPVTFVNAVTRMQTGSLPVSPDPEPCESGVAVYFTNWSYAGIDMAVLADRQFKSAPKALLPKSNIFNGWPQNHEFQHPAIKDPKVLDHPDAKLLGERQLKFLGSWAERQGADFKLVFSASPFSCLQTLPADLFGDDVVPNLPRMKPGQYPDNDIPKLDYDANGWPQTGRDKAVKLLTEAHAVHLVGDQHLGTTGQYGREAFNDSAWWMASPAIANVWPRRWFPKEAGANRREGDPRYTGEFFDGFGNRVTLHAVANPYDVDREPGRLYDKAVGYSLVTLNRNSGEVELACWPYWAGPKAEEKSPFPGWPITIDPKTNRRVK